MKRFTAKVIVIGLIATVVWWGTASWTRPATVALAKGLHTIVGYPAPYLLADLDKYYWFSPLFPPLFGLVLASNWVSWRHRLLGLAISLAGFWYLVALQIALVYSPYLTLSAERAYLTSMQVALNSVVVPVVLWLIITRGTPADWNHKGGPVARPKGAPSLAKGAPFFAQRRVGDGRSPANTPSPTHASHEWGTRSTARPGTQRPRIMVTALLVTLFCVVMTLAFPLSASQTTPTLSAARKVVAGAIAGNQPSAAVDAIEGMFSAQSENTALSYLQFQLYNSLGHAQSAERVQLKALTTSERRAAYLSSGR